MSGHMNCKNSTALALAAALLLAFAPAAQAHGDHGAYYGAAYAPAAYARAGNARPGYVAPYGGHWHGNTYYAAGRAWGGSVDAQLFAASANGDLWGAKSLVERGANVDARDAEGLTPLAWAAQYGRTEVAKYLIAQRANLNPADKFGFTPLMWAAQEGQQGMVDLLLTKGANPWVVTRNGITAHTLARYSGSWRTASMLEDWLAGRRRSAAPARQAAKPVVPVRVTVVAPPAAASAAAPVIAAPAMETAKAVAAEPGMLAKAMTFKKLADAGKLFGDDFTAFVKVSTSGGFSLNALQAATSPDMETGKLLTSFFANVVRTQDLKAARADLDKAKASLGGNANARFARYVTDAEKALTEGGF